MDPMVIIISLMVLATVTVLVLALSGRATLRSGHMQKRLDAFRTDSPTGEVDAESEEEGPHFRHREYSGLPILSAFFAGMKGSENVAVQLERAGVPLRVGEYYMIRWCVAGVMFLVPFVFGISLFNAAVGLGLGILGYMLPAQWVNNQRKKRVDRINAQLVDLLGMTSNSLKSGYGLMQGFEFSSKQLPDPLGQEVRRMLRESTLGMSAEQALAALGERISSKDMDMVITAINIQRSVGGNLAEILDNVAHTMRERERIRGEINTLTAQQKMTGIVIGLLPVFMFMIFMVVNPDYMSLLFETTAGRLIIAGSIVMEIMGYFMIKRIMAIEV
jgi:tight adherence protein B